MSTSSPLTLHSPLTSAQRFELESVTLPVRPGCLPSEKSDVRIFLGSGESHARAERVFAWSIERVRDPSRRYRIFLMRGLPGFSRTGLGAESSRYRFVVPGLAGGQGRAIYNDVGQIYLEDPALLFDLELGGRGSLAASSKGAAPVLYDCAPMARVWDQEAVCEQDEVSLLARAREEPDLCGTLESAWHPQAESELQPGTTRVLHYVSSHTQPWRPFPERCIYHRSAAEGLWRELEQEADEADFELFSAAAASLAFDRLHEDFQVRRTRPDCGPAPATGRGVVAECVGDVQGVIQRVEAKSLLDCSLQATDVLAAGSCGYTHQPLLDWSANVRAERLRYDAVACLDALHEIPLQDLPWVMRELFASSRGVVYVALPVASHGSRGEEAWRERFEALGNQFPAIHWVLRLHGGATSAGSESSRLFHGGRWLEEREPRVWVLTDGRPGNATQSAGLAAALDWPFEVKELRCGPLSILHNRLLKASTIGIRRHLSSPLEPPWPDLVIATGRRTAPVAQWIREQNGGQTRLVALGRKAGDAAALCDLAVTPEYCRCTPHPRRMEISVPLHRMTPESLRESEKEWSGKLQTRGPGPRVALVVGGVSGQYCFDAGVARRMGREVSQFVESRNGVLWVTTSRRSGEAPTAALAQAVGEVDRFHRWSASGGDENPYRGYLACADVFVITGDSESMLAEACFTGKPVYIYPLPVRSSFRALGFFRDRIVELAGLGNRGDGNERPQRRLAYFCSWLIAKGFVRPTRDLDLLHASLVRRGVARYFGGDIGAASSAALCETEDVAKRVRQLMGF